MSLTRTRRAMLALLSGILAVSAAHAIVRIGGSIVSGAPAVRFYDDANPQAPVLTDRTEYLPQAGAYALVHDGLFVSGGNSVRLYDRRDPDLPARATWNAGTPILALEGGPQRGLVLVLDASSLRLVSFPDGGVPSTVWSYPIDETLLTGTPGRLVVRDGNRAYVADASIPGVRVLSVDPLSFPQSLAVYTSAQGVVHHLTLWNRTLTLLTAQRLVAVDAGDPQAPTFTEMGSFRTTNRPSWSDANTRWAFVADGQDLLVLDINPASQGFLTAPVASFRAPTAVRALRLDKANRLYLLEGGQYEILDVSPFGGR